MSINPTESSLGPTGPIEGNVPEDLPDLHGAYPSITFINFDESDEIIVPRDFSGVASLDSVDSGPSTIFELPSSNNNSELPRFFSPAEFGLPASQTENAIPTGSDGDFASAPRALARGTLASSAVSDFIDGSGTNSEDRSRVADVGAGTKFDPTLSVLADLWDTQVNQAIRASDTLKGQLEVYVDEGGNWALAAAGATLLDVAGYAMKFTQGLADTSRLGKGISKGTLEGAYEDLERALNVLPQWRIVKIVGYGTDVLNMTQAVAHGDIKSGVVAALGVVGAAGAHKNTKLSGTALKKKQDILEKNKITGREFEETLRPAYEQAGFTVKYLRREVGFKAPAIKTANGKTISPGWRWPDAAIYYKGELVEFLEFKSSPTAVYTLRQRLRDAWAYNTGRPITSVIRPDVLGK